MRRSWLSAGVLAIGLSVAGVGCGDSGQDDGDLSGSGDNLKGRDKDKATAPQKAADAGAKSDPVVRDAAKEEPKPDEASACAALLCPTNTRCVVKEVQCIRAPCPPVASCEPIDPPATCAVTLCKEGTTCVEGPNGAQCVEQNGAGSCAATLCREGTTCVEGPNGAQCVEQTCTAKCSAGQHCELQEVQCIKEPCPPVPTCVDDLDACATVKCKAGTHCVSTQPQCFTTPCPPIAECTPN